MRQANQLDARTTPHRFYLAIDTKFAERALARRLTVVVRG